MTSDYLRLLKQDFSDCEEASTAWHRLSTHMDELHDRHRTKVTGPLHSNWSGDDADAALFYLEDLEKRFGIVRTEAMALSEVIALARAKMILAQNHLRSTVKEIESEGLHVDDEGVVRPPKDRESPQKGETEQDRFDLFTKLENYQTEVNGCVGRAKQASDEAVKALDNLGGDILQGNIDDSAGEARDDVKQVSKALHTDIGKPYPPHDPKGAAEWWKNLPESQRESYAALHPEILGKTDGLPSGVRDDANRLALDQELSAMENYEYHDKYSEDDYNKRLNNLQTLQAELDKRDSATGDKQLYVLGFDSSGDGKAVLAMGNPDTADNVGVQVPGTATTMESTGGQLQRVDALRRSAEGADPSAKTSMVYWLGYDAPEVPVSQAGNLGVAGTGRAEDAAPDLRNFTHGLRASHEGEGRAHMTVLGHSYGSTVVGAAASGEGGLDADSIAVVGSPGMTVDKAEQLNIDPDHVYVGRAPDDDIKYAGGTTLGPDPAVPGGVFGGHRFKVDTEGHSGYWDESESGPSESLRNQGRIIAGQSPSDGPKPPHTEPIPTPPHHRWNF
ncbi:alpha/beta hydrolase [Streptomyces sp. NPDC047049]|uniref:alpha/beta hydrolase n=1 Tax=Streptomyces sp. NPDC047049 TaxID=3156688 RepID=UPI0033C3DFEC